MSALVEAVAGGAVTAATGAVCVWIGRISAGVTKTRRDEREKERQHQASRDEKLVEITEALNGRKPSGFDRLGSKGLIQDVADLSTQIQANSTLIRDHAMRDEEIFERISNRLDTGDARMVSIEKGLKP